MLDLYHAISACLEALGDDVQIKTTDQYVAFRRMKNSSCVEVRKLLVYLRVSPDTVALEPGFSRDVRASATSARVISN